MNARPAPPAPLAASRRGLCAAALGAGLGAWLGMPAGAARAAQPATAPETALPTPSSLQDALREALARREPLTVMVSLHGCVFCEQARRSFLLPLRREGQPMVQIEWRAATAVRGFDGQPTTHEALARAWGIAVAPTLLFFGPGAAEVAERMAGAYVPDFYGAYLADRLQAARERLRPA